MKRRGHLVEVFLAFENQISFSAARVLERTWWNLRRERAGRAVFKFASLREFVLEIGIRPSDFHSVDRICPWDVYVSGNVRWATRAEQASNKRSNHAQCGRDGCQGLQGCK